MTMKSTALFPLLLASALVPVALRADETNHWSFGVTPYLWVAGIQVDTRLPNLPPSTPPEAGRFDTRITGGAMLAAEVRYRSVGLWLDFAWLRLNTEASSPQLLISNCFSRGQLY